MEDLPIGLQQYRGQLREAVAYDLRRRSRSLMALRVALPTVAVGAAAAAAVVLLTGGPQASSADAAILRGVAAALTPPSEAILHERAFVTVAGQAPARYELWEQTDSPHAYRVVKFGREGAWDGSTDSNYDPTSNTIVETAATGGSSGSRGGVDDAAAVLRSLVDSGKAKIESATTFDGVDAYKLSVSGADQHYLNGTVYVARSDYKPLEIDTTTDSPTGPLTETIHYDEYEYLPADTANLRLLDLAAQHPGATVVNKDASEGGTTTTAK